MYDGKHMTLGIETSCDETAVAVVAEGREILSNTIASQVDIHREFGGVVPEIASRHHLGNLNFVLSKSLEEAGIELSDVDLIGVAAGPGLAGALIVGTSFAKALALACDKPLAGVHHIQAHIMASLLVEKELEPPFLSAVMSGGHTHIIDVLGYNEFKILGRTRDDAAGEAFDKVARVLGLGYPGGPAVDDAAKKGNPDAVHFKRVYLEKDSLDFSFSGTKTAVINHIQKLERAGEEVNHFDIAAGFQQAVAEVIVDKCMAAIEMSGRDTLSIGGGVARNSLIRRMLAEACEEKDVRLIIPPPDLCSDNGAMIAAAAYGKWRLGLLSDLYLDVWPGLNIQDGLSKLDAVPRSA